MAFAAPPPPALGLLDLPPELIERILIAVGDLRSLRAAALTCTRLAAATAPASPLWRSLLATSVDLCPLPDAATGWETAFFLRGWTGVAAAGWGGALAADGGLDSSGASGRDAAAAEVGRYVGGEWEDGALSAFPDPPTAQDIAKGGYDPQQGRVAPYPQHPDEEWDAPSGGAPALGGTAGRGEGGGQLTAAADAPFPVGSFLYVDNRPGRGGAALTGAGGGGAASVGGAATAGTAAADPHPSLRAPAAAASTTSPADEGDPRLLYAAAVALSRAAAVLADDTLMIHSDWGWGSEATTGTYHALAVRLPDGGVPWPSAGASSADDAVTAAAQAVLAAAGATYDAQDQIEPRHHWRGHGDDPKVRPSWSGHPGGPLFHARITRRALRNGPYWWTARHGTPCASRRRLRAAYGVLGDLLGDRPLLAFSFGRYAMNPVGGALLVRWAPSLAVGYLFELTCS
ncbi:hypothetical protein BU14_2163s0001 [Porphyra umbilicalis]|uniref:F-box domain-containing protein n=1 Tax=Porphyra umbilicalis TaxID=2786 RepID=A0A1X6NJT1_PORUM|nr:hypothetical protein BU14_2163s0001 [Porphyra umbilicalis]|eukprot:OSX68858.1 hypothetical protein BU14_2163s0001 [Porphyra umbilicalis]